MPIIYDECSEQEGPPLAITQEEAERIVKEAARFFGITKHIRVHLVSADEVKRQFGIAEEVQALCRFDPNQADADIYLVVDRAREAVHALYHEVCHLAFIDLHQAIADLETTHERLVDYFAFLALRRKKVRHAGRRRTSA